MPLHQPIADEADQRRREPADEAEREHGDDHGYGDTVHVGTEDQIAEAEIAGHHLRGDEREPGDADADLQAGEDERKRARQHQVAEDVPETRSVATGRADVEYDA